jgi:quercetin dioxygenase-like cupin family protein
MNSPAASTIEPIALRRDEGEALWFLTSLAMIRSSAETTGGQVAVIEHLSPPGPGSPLHVHSREDEWFYVIDGELTFWVGGQVIKAPAGTFVYGPRGIPHTFVISSDEPARFLLVTQPAGFEKFVRAVGRPAEQLTVPPPPSEPPDPEPLIAAAAQQGIEILGPPGIPD